MLPCVLGRACWLECIGDKGGTGEGKEESKGESSLSGAKSAIEAQWSPSALRSPGIIVVLNVERGSAFVMGYLRTASLSASQNGTVKASCALLASSRPGLS